MISVWSARVRDNNSSTSPRICSAMVWMEERKRLRSVSLHVPDCRSSVSVRITVRGVLSSWEASDTNCLCCSQACSTGCTAQRASRMLTIRNSTRPAKPISRQFVSRWLMTRVSLEVSEKTMVVCPSRVSLLRYRRW